MTEFANKLLVDCFVRHGNEYLFVKRKKSESWFPGALGTLWREVKNKTSPFQELLKLLDECGIKPKKISLRAIANNCFIDTKEVFNVFLFTVEVDEKPDIKVPEGEETVWIGYDKIFSNSLVLREYKEMLPRLSDEKILFYHTKYDFDKFLKIEFYS